MAALPCLRCQLTVLCQPTAAFTLRKLYEKLLRPIDEHSQERAEGGYGLLGG